MFNKHLFKVIAGFCGMIILGLILLVIIDSYQPKNKVSKVVPEVQATNNINSKPKSVTLPSVKKSTVSTPKKRIR